MGSHFTKQSEIQRKWHVVDAKGRVVGRLASHLARVLVGKNKPTYTPHVDDGDYVVVVNASQVRFTGNKWEKKQYYRHTGYPGGIKSLTAKEQLARKPGAILRKAVWGMMSKSDLSRRQLMKLKIYDGPKHPHVAQSPVAMEIE